MKIKLSLGLLLAVCSCTWAANKPFELILQPGKTEYFITARQAGTYWIAAHTRAKVPVGIQHFCDFRWDQGLPQHRRLLQSNQTDHIMVLDRVIFSAGQTRKLSFKYDEKQVTVDRIAFRPQLPFRTPKAAVDYRPALTPPVHHPRLLVNPSYLVWLKNNLNIGENAPVWNKLAKRAKKPYIFKLDPNEELGFQGALVSVIRQKAFYYLVTGDKTVGQEAVRLIRLYMDNVSCGNGQDICRKNGENIYTAALVYDWCYRLLTAEDKAALHERMLYFAAEMETGWPPFAESAAVGHANEAQINRDELAMAIALYNEDPEPFKFVMYQMLENQKPSKGLLYQSGRHDQGTSYGQWRFGWDLFGALQFRRTFNAELLPKEAAVVPYAWYYIRTPDGRFLAEGDSNWDWRAGYKALSSQLLMAVLALYPDPELKEELYRGEPKIAGNCDPVFFLLTNDPKLKARDRRAGMPLTKHFKDPLPGLYLRTGWNFSTAADDAVVTMNGAQYHYRNHQHLDMGAFQIYYRGNLAADLGQYRIYGVPYDMNLAKTSALHSLMRFQDPEQIRWKQHAKVCINCGGEEIPNWSPAPNLQKQLKDDFYRSGSTPFAGSGPDKVRPVYNFMEIDLARLFPGRVKDYTRTFVFLNQEDANRPGTLLILDRFHTAKAGVQPIFQLTSIARPVWENGILKIRTAPYGRTGQLTLKPLIPDRVEAKLLTGRDAHTFAGKYIPPRNPKQPEANGTRTELTGPGSIYLNALQIHDGDTEPVPVHQTRQGERICADLDMSKTADHGGYLVLFGNPLSPAVGAVSFTVPRDHMRVLVLDLAPGYWDCGKIKLKVDPENGSAFLLLDRGQYTLSPGSKGRIAPVPGIKAKPTPPPADNQLIVNGKLIQGVKTVPSGNTFLVPLAAIVKPAGNTLNLTVRDIPVTLRTGDPKISVNGMDIPLPSPLGPDFAVPCMLAGTLLNMTAETDTAGGSVFLTSREKDSPVLTVSASGGIEGLQELLFRQRGEWIAHGRDVTAEILFVKPVPLSGMEFDWPHGQVRKAFFRVDLSADGKNFETVFDGASSGHEMTSVVSFPRRNVRMIRLYMKGNSVNTWNTVGGIRFPDRQQNK